MKKTKEQGITLIALVITIIVLLVLAGVALASLTGNSSIIDNANHAVGEYNKSANADQNSINKAEGLFAQYTEEDAEYRIVYYANGGTGTMDEEEASRTGTSTFTPPEGKVFREWNTAADGSGTSYAAGERIPSDVTLYAIWMSEELQIQYGNLVFDEEEIHQEYFRYQILTEPSVSVVRNTPKQDREEGVVSRGDTPTATTQKGTAKMIGIDWAYFLPAYSTYYTTGNVTGTGSFVTTQEKATEIQEKLKKLVIPYEVTINDKVYTITEIVFPSLPAGSDSWRTGNVDSYTINYHSITDYYLPILARNIYNGCESVGLESYLIIPNSVSSITGAYLNIPRNHVILPKNESFNKIKADSLKNIYGMESIVIPDSVTELGGYAFDSCDALKTITVPNTVTSIGNQAFGHCKSLTTATIKGDLTTLGGNAFYCCESLSTAEFKGNVTNIGNWAFDGCISLSNITFVGNVETIGKGAFDDCRALTTITIPNTVTSIGGAAFRGCTGLKTITYNGVTYKKIQELINALTTNNVTLGIHQWTQRVNDNEVTMSVLQLLSQMFSY